MTKLNVIERLTILGILPKEDSFATLKLIRDLTSKIGLNADELKTFEIKQEGGNVSWNKKGSEELEIDIKEKESDVIVDALKELDKTKKLSNVHISLYEKFVTD